MNQNKKDSSLSILKRHPFCILVTLLAGFYINTFFEGVSFFIMAFAFAFFMTWLIRQLDKSNQREKENQLEKSLEETRGTLV